MKKISQIFKFKPFSKKQRKVLNWWCPASPVKDYDGIIADGAIRSGKTLCMSLSFEMWAMASFNGQNFGMCGKTIGSFRRNVLFWLKLMLKSRGYKVTDHRADNLVIVSKGDAENYFYIFGGKDERSQDLIQGITLAGCFFDEVALMPESFVNQATGRCFVDGSKYWFNCNPDGPYHWFKVNWIDKLQEKNLLYIYKNKTASQVLKMVCSDFGLKAGKITDTKHVISKKLESNKTLFDIVQNALDDTMQSEGKLYVLYDDFGRICLTDVADMKLNLLICDETAEGFTYTSSIDRDVYNKIKLAYTNQETGKIETYIAQDSKNINKWGVLQYYQSEQNNAGLKSKTNSLLKLYNRKSRNLTIKNAAGDIRVRAGCSLLVSLTLDDIRINNYMLVDEVTHTFKENVHTMDLKLIGGDFV